MACGSALAAISAADLIDVRAVVEVEQPTHRALVQTGRRASTVLVIRYVRIASYSASLAVTGAAGRRRSARAGLGVGISRPSLMQPPSVVIRQSTALAPPALASVTPKLCAAGTSSNCTSTPPVSGCNRHGKAGFVGLPDDRSRLLGPRSHRILLRSPSAQSHGFEA